MIKLISFKICPCYQKISTFLEAKGIAYEPEFLDLANVPEWFLKISPQMEPAIQTTDGHYISGLDASIAYLESNYLQLMENAVSEDEELISLGHQIYIIQCTTQRSKDLNTFIENNSFLQSGLKKMEDHLADRKPFNNGRLSMLDITWLPILHRARIIEKKTGFEFFDNFPEIKLWQTKLLATGIAEQSVPEDFDEVFEDFYLNDATFLGTISNLKKKEIIKEVPSVGCSCN